LWGPYATYYVAGGGINFSSYTELTYYKKGNDSCGTYFDFPLGLNPLALNKIEFKLFPNPVSDNLKIAASTLLSEYSIFSTNGKIVLSGKLMDNEINIKTLPTGIYHLQVFDSKSNRVSKIFMKK
jgi:hypothetical protein